ncbi:MAG: hypothetical protein KBS86_00200 [Proteobacteria bacterium]|nr:hypothetical protein [Candidatus Enterousia scatequi]
MNNILLLTLFGTLIIGILVILIYEYKNSNRIANINKTLEYQYNLIVKIQSVLKTKNATNTVAEHAEIIYEDLLQALIPIMALTDVMPRSTNEHPLWRAIGGIMDEYAKNPFVLEKLRRGIKLDPEIARNVDNYMARANKLLNYLTTTDPDGILTSTFTDGLLGQSITFFAQAQQLAAPTGNDRDI